ncbi:MAG: hypothetical protein M9894_16040 [Planctomycetes bacterium]|nr:hypothetical protein [Planctomycetota bacterium]
MTVFVATWGMDHEHDEVVAVALDEVDARAALERHVASQHVSPPLPFAWQPLPRGGSSARMWDLYTASVQPFELIA